MLRLLRFPPLRAAGRLRRPVRRVIVVQAKPNPSHDYYLAPRLAAPGMPAHEVHSLAASPGAIAPDRFDGALVLFCRYLNRPWLAAAEAMADRIAGIGYFIDDDLDALFADRTVPLSYRLTIAWRALIHRRRLSRSLDLAYASSPVIGRRHDVGGLRILAPLAGPEDEPAFHVPAAHPGDAGERPLRLAFHSTRVHAGEHRWLAALMRELMPRLPGTMLEVYAETSLQPLWQGVPQTLLRTALPWPLFRQRTREDGADLLLAPLLDNEGNAGRSPTKRIEAMRLGAALLVSDPAIYRPGPEEEALGMCVPAEPAPWMAAIETLATDRPRLARLRALNREAVLAAQPGAEPLLRPDEIA
ncbi:hypothetical protein [Enterovirga rhinocerotis]|uniref:Glycosyltransferase involved in cell wall biosynthesis n=1 Tax=Enterovirga rhinocerotis TaxID=1339210 RepID=A0A4R7BW93_9HYPH|nr:hypothetical protein [Enterovirga rhinocerotis]TDR89831.1 hypothetical protein EV668_2667 [Enterovirga rhinocerotis]